MSGLTTLVLPLLMWKMAITRENNKIAKGAKYSPHLRKKLSLMGWLKIRFYNKDAVH